MGELLIYAVDALWLTVLAAIIAKHRLQAILVPLTWCAAAHVMFFAAPPANAALMVGMVHLIASLSILIGYWLVVNRSVLPESKRVRRPFEQFHVDKVAVQVAFLLFCWVLVVLAKMMAYLQGVPLLDLFFAMRLAEEPQLGTTTTLLLTFMARTPVVGVALGRLWLEVAPSRATRIMWWILVVSFLTMGFTSGGRTALGFPILIVFVVDVYVLTVLRLEQTRSQRRARAFLYALFAAGLLLGMSYQSMFRGLAPGSFAEALGRFQTVLDPEVGPEGNTFGEELANGLNDYVAFVVDNYGTRIPFAYGYSLHAMLVNPIPRVLWRDKPPGWGQRLAFEVLNKRPDAAFGTSMAAGISGEAYANGGFLGVASFGMLFGVLFGWIRRRILLAQSLFAASIWLAALTWTLGLYRGDWLSNVNRGVYCLVSAAIMYQLLRLVMGRTQERWTVRSVETSRGGHEHQMAPGVAH